MDTNVKVVGWLWIVNASLSILMFVVSIGILNFPGTVPEQQSRIIASVGSLCFFIPGIIAYFATGFGLLKYKGWARILAIILAILNLCLFPIGTALGIYTLVIMFNDETKTLFNGQVAPAEMEDVSS